MPDTGTVADVSDEDLVKRAIRNARHAKSEPKWSAVSRAFGLGSTYSIQLCRRFDFDPDEKPGARIR